MVSANYQRRTGFLVPAREEVTIPFELANGLGGIQLRDPRDIRRL